MPRRLFVCDPVCVLPYGHNAAALRNYRQFLGSRFSSCECLAAKYFAGPEVESGLIKPAFEHYYNDVIPVLTTENGVSIQIPDPHDNKRSMAQNDLKEIIKVYNITGDDVLCYPSVDFYSLQALVDSIALLKRHGSPKILIRFIGVMETACADAFREPLKVALANTRLLLESGIEVRISAEVPKYAEYLAVELDTFVAVTAPAEVRPYLPTQDKGYFEIVCPGSAREDKGFFKLERIFRAIRSKDPDLNIRFTSQILPDGDMRSQQSYHVKLYSIPGVTLLPSKVAPEVIDDIYRRADLVLMPYDPCIYQWRGSAVLAEAICAGRPIVTLDGTGFADVVRFFGAGAVCSDESDLEQTLVRLSNRPSAEVHAAVRQTRESFIFNNVAAYNAWVG